MLVSRRQIFLTWRRWLYKVALCKVIPNQLRMLPRSRQYCGLPGEKSRQLLSEGGDKKTQFQILFFEVTPVVLLFFGGTECPKSRYKAFIISRSSALTGRRPLISIRVC